MDNDIPYLLLTPGPLTTSRTVRQAMMHDYCTWDEDYNCLVTDIRRRLVQLATDTNDYTVILMQGSGSFSVEATLGSVVPPKGKLLVFVNGAYGRRMVQIADKLRIPCVGITQPETEPADTAALERTLQSDPSITHVCMVHCETTTGLLNPAKEVGSIVRRYGRIYILDAMSSFGGIPLRIGQIGAHYLISSSNKCIQGVPGFAFVIAEKKHFSLTAGWARSLCLDLYDQWQEMEIKGGKWRYTSPTHVVRAFLQALQELDEEGGVKARHRRYSANHAALVTGMSELGFRALLPAALQSPIITSFLYPAIDSFSFASLYQALKRRRFVIYPGKISNAGTFRIGTIGHVFPSDIESLLEAVRDALTELGWLPWQRNLQTAEMPQ